MAMRLISIRRLEEWGKAHPRAARPLRTWAAVVKNCRWTGLADARATFGKRVDETKVASGRKVAVFDICGTDYRLIAAVHYNLGKVFLLRFLTHAEYSKELWKGQL